MGRKWERWPRRGLPDDVLGRAAALVDVEEEAGGEGRLPETPTT